VGPHQAAERAAKKDALQARALGAGKAVCFAPSGELPGQAI